MYRLMGCGTSSDSGYTENVTPEPSDYQQQLSVNHVDMQNQTILEAYQKLDEEIGQLEKMCPGPRLAAADSWIKFLESRQTISDSDIVQLPLHMLDNEDTEEEELKYDRGDRLEKDVQSLAKVRQLAEKLNVATNLKQAAKYEEFLASISRRYINDCVRLLTDEVLEHAQKRATHLLEQYNKLRTLYTEQDALIASITGGTYTSQSEQKFDEELEMTRQIRDKLGGAVEQWRTAANLLRASAKSAAVGNEQWALISSSSLAKDKITLATDCRSSILGSLTAFKCAQEALPQVEIPHITNRQIVAVSHANEYLLTDIANPDRYQHTRNVLNVYQKGLSESINWLHDIFTKTLKKDLDDAEEGVVTLAKKLRQIRINYIKIRIGNKLYNPDEMVSRV